MAMCPTVWWLSWRTREPGHPWASEVVRRGPRGGEPRIKDARARAVELAPEAHKFEVYVSRWNDSGVHLKTTVRVRGGKVTVRKHQRLPAPNQGARAWNG